MGEKKPAKSPKKRTELLIIVLFLGFIVVVAATGFAMSVTSSTAFCMACHEMEPYLAELRLSSHAQDKDGLDTNCSQCHIPPGLGPSYFTVKINSGVRHVFEHFWTQPDRLNRVQSQKVARRFVDDANCLACHQDLALNAKGDGPVSEYGQLVHDAYLGKNGSTKSNCAGCHVNLAHLPGFDQRLLVNAEFTARLKQQEVKR